MKQFLEIIQSGQILTQQQAHEAMNDILSGEATDIQIAAFLMGLAVRGEKMEEIIGMVESIRLRMKPLDLANNNSIVILDTCGTGGDGQHTFNLSTAAALICAALGVKVAKHGNRAASSLCGSADLLEVIDISINLDAEAAKHYFREHGFVFLFAPNFHPAMKRVAPIRKALGIRTIFNFLGPLVNPARVTHQLIGISESTKAEQLGNVLIATGSQHVVIVSSEDGLDEVSIAAPTQVLDITPQATRHFTIKPNREFSIDDIRGGSPEYNAKLLKALANGKGKAGLREAVAMNAGLALYAADNVSSYEVGKQKAEEFLQSGELAKYLRMLSVST